jgi:hypothetical protein
MARGLATLIDRVTVGLPRDVAAFAFGWFGGPALREALGRRGRRLWDWVRIIDAIAVRAEERQSCLLRSRGG